VDIRTRPLGAGDKEAWLQLWQGYLTFYKSSIADEVTETTWQRLLSDEEHCHSCLVAVGAADRPIGIAHYLFHRSTWSDTWYCYMEDLFVSPDVRGSGAGRALIEAVYEQADACGCTRTYWATQEFNHGARMLYDKVATKSPILQYRR
jgi:GNAT superfamily N-acetyltransferase